MNGFDIWNAIVGSGFLVGFLSIWLNWKNSKSKNNIDWYDRAIKEIERLEKRLQSTVDELDALSIELSDEKDKNDRLTEENQFLSSKVDELQVIIKEIRIELDTLIKRREEHDEQ